jgi:asparagine synthetase B (glutamine-hydrolysing)
VHQRSDVPYGLFLSGGIDSASIAALMARLNERPVTAFTCGFDVPSARDERAQAERVATALKLDWRETTFGEEDFWRILPQVAWALDDPTADYATLPTYKLAEAAKGTLTVVLTGEGGDELFGGYGRYRRALRPALFGGRPAEPQIDAPFLKDGGRAALERWRARAYATGTRRHWLPTRPAEDGDLIARLDAVLEDSVRVHQRSDVPYGLFLSGGIDSAAIATLMARLNERPVTAFTCGYDAPGAKDERAQAERVATALKLDWRETTFSEEDFWRILPQVAWALDDPTADYATLPTYKLAEAAKGTLTVVLTGEGGDELFGGYGRYRRALRPTWLGGRPAEPQGASPEMLARWRDEGRAPERLTRLQQAQWADVATWLPNDLLLKLDRCLMAHGLEGRTPFLDPEVARFAFPLPDRFKVRGRYGKWLLRKWLERACPAAQPWARKQGFTVPVEAWIAPRASDIAARIGQVEAVRRIRPDAAAAFADAASAERWPLLFYGLWSLIHLEGAAPQEALTQVVGRL